ncbi:SPOC like C-terminal domain-containing protein [Radiomyces spectabilis]|uniref:SPOC like C-terminal domain-containing protein n=1 Tax=Radiomyces spectabilis TaxID=64574 RepID=UPI00221F5514|nr:SPOC like C-terminal domain-containing protein [Radiomyces spectabilis]KAI8384252.1 SPOC like C-terminal domain-containing protein [Radiomyces spectabilis]
MSDSQRSSYHSTYSSQTLFDDDIDDDQALNDDIQTAFANKDSILFAIDCGPTMLVPDASGKIPLRVAFACVQSVLMNKIFSSESDLVGVLLFSTEKKRNAANHDHIYVLQNLDVPDAHRIKEMEALAKGPTDFEKEYGSTKEEYPFGNVFWTCTDLFAASTQKKGTRRIFLITNTDNPHADNANLRNSAIRRAKDLWDVGIRIELFGLDQSDGHHFDYKLFYSEIMAMEDEEADGDDDESRLDSKDYQSSMNKLEELMQKIRRKEVKKRSQFRIPFHLAEGLTIGVRGYAIVMEQKKGTPKKVVTSGRQLLEIDTQTTWKCADTDQYLLPFDIKYYYAYGGENIVFTKEDLQKVRNFGDPGLVLIGFKPRASLLPYYNITHPYFIYPNETDYEGSTRTFSALLRTMVKLDQIGICSFFRRTNSLPKLVALYPQPEVLDNNQVQITPPGFHLITLPFADDIRPLPVEQTADANVDEIDAAKKFVEKLSFNQGFDPAAYENPSLQRHYATLQAIALEKEVDEIEDRTLPNTKVIHERLGKDIEHFKTLIGQDMEIEPEAPKRKSQGESTSSKRAKGALSVEDHWRDQSLDKCLVAELKTWLKENGVTPKARKADLVQQVSKLLESRHA